MKLRTILQGLTPNQLSAIADFWQLSPPADIDPSTPEGHRRLVEFLYPRMQTAKYFFKTCERIRETQRTLLKFLAVHGGELPLQEIETRCYRGDSDLARADIEDLATKGFLHVDLSESDHPYVVLPESVLCNFELGTQLTGFLGAILQKMPYNDLAALGVRLTGDKKYYSYPRERLIRRIREFLLDPQQLQRHIESLPRDERELFDVLVERDGYAFYGDLLEAGGRRRFDLARTESLNSLLSKRGIVYVASQGANKHANLLMVPRDILYIVVHDFTADQRNLEELEALVARTDTFKPAVVVDNSSVLYRDLVVLASFIHGNNFKVLASGGISRADLRRALPLLGPNRTLKYLTFLAAFLISAKHLNPVSGVWRLSDSFYEALSNPSHLYVQLFNWWMEVNDWNEAIPEGLIWDEDQVTHGFAALIEMRHHVLDAILAWSDGAGWIPYLSFEELVLPKLVAAVGGASQVGRSGAGAQVPLRRILYSIVTEPLTWLGLVALGATDKNVFSSDTPIDLESLSKKQNLKKVEQAALSFSFHPTPFARDLFERGAIRPREVFQEIAPDVFPLNFAADWIIVQPNCEVVAPPDLRLTHLLRLCGFCEVRGVDVMTSLAITRDSLRRALDCGIRGKDVRGLLSELSRSGLPPTVDQLVADVLEQHGEAFVAAAGGYLVSDDPAVIEQIRLHGKFEDLLKDEIAKKALILAPGVDLERFARDLRSLGLMPRLEAGTVQSSLDNRFHLSLSLEDYYELLALLKLVREVEEQLDYDITTERAHALMYRLEPDSASFAMVHEEAHRLAAAYERRLKEALSSLRRQIEDKYKSQVSRIVAKAGAHRGTTRFHYRGQNPAIERQDVIDLLRFAVDHELEVEIQYVKRNEAEVTLRIYPKSFEGTRIYAYCVEADREAMYSLERILKAKLL